VDICCNKSAFSESIPKHLENLLISVFNRQMCSDPLYLPDICRTVFDSTTYLLSIQAQKLPSLFDSFLRDSLSTCTLPSSSRNILASVFDAEKTKSTDSGFKFVAESVTFPNGPVVVFGDKVVGEEVNASYWSFIFRGGNTAWSCGLVPEKESHTKDVLWKRANSIGRYHSGSGCALQQQSMPESATITLHVSYISKTAMFFREGVLTSTAEVPESEVCSTVHDLSNIFLLIIEMGVLIFLPSLYLFLVSVAAWYLRPQRFSFRASGHGCIQICPRFSPYFLVKWCTTNVKCKSSCHFHRGCSRRSVGCESC
jgi:hypothetical protein